jgi:soluble lytic murein transglycosylase
MFLPSLSCGSRRTFKRFLKLSATVFLILALISCAPHDVVPPDLATAPAPAALAPKPALAALEPNNAEQNFRIVLDALKTNRADAALLIARKITEQYPNTPWYKRALFATELSFIQLDCSDYAEAAMLRVQQEYPELAEYAALVLADYHANAGRFTRAAALYGQIVERWPDTITAARALYRQGAALANDADYSSASDVFGRFLQDYPKHELAPDAELGLARALVAELRMDRAIGAYRELWSRYAGSPNDDEAERALRELKISGIDVPEPTFDELAERGANLYRLNRFDKAATVYARALELGRDKPARSEVLYKSGVSLFYMGKRNESAAQFEKMVREHPGDQRAAEAWFWLGKSHSKLGNWDTAIAAFRTVLDRYPESEWADDALLLTGNIYRELNDSQKAIRYYDRLVAEYPDSKLADSATWWKAWFSYSAGDYRKAEQILQQIPKRWPRSFLVHQARYWQGRAAEKRGDGTRAAAYYSMLLKKGPNTYYGYRAQERLAAMKQPVVTSALTGTAANGECPDEPCASDAPDIYDADETPVWTEETKQLLEAEPLFRKTLELMRLDMKKDAAQELWALQERLPKRRGMFVGLSKAFFELGEYNRSLQLIVRNYERFLDASSSGASSDVWRLAYPQGYWDSVTTYARRYNQDPYFIAALIREESQFAPDALSFAGARGLMQVMPVTGEWAAPQIGIKKFDRDKLFEADTAVNIGTWYAARLVKRFKGDLFLAAAAYNAGPDAVIGWLAKNGSHGERDLFVETIPYAETRNYVKKVMRNYAEYRRLYARASGSGTASGAVQ